MSLRVTLLAIVLLPATALPPPASGLFEQLRSSQQLFEATVISHSRTRVAFVTPKGASLHPQECEELELRVTRVLHGASIPPHVRLRTLLGVAGSGIAPGAHVLALCRRSEADHWNLWGEAFPVTANGLVLPGAYVASTNPHDPSKMLTISDVRMDAATPSAEEPDRLFRMVRHLQVVVVARKDILAQNSADLLCSPIGAVFGQPHAGQISVHVTAPPGAPCSFVAVGDTLIVPDADTQPRQELEIHGCADWLIVTRGFLPGLGVPLSEAATAFEPGPAGYKLRTTVSPDSAK